MPYFKGTKLQNLSRIGSLKSPDSTPTLTIFDWPTKCLASPTYKSQIAFSNVYSYTNAFWPFMLNKFVLLPFFFIFILSAFGQDADSTQIRQKDVTLSGFVTSGITGEALITARVYIPSLQKGVLTNNYGFYSLSVPPGTYLVEYRFTGLENTLQQVVLTENTDLDIEIGSKSQKLEEVQVNAKKGENINSTKMGQVELEVEKIKTLPAFMGEVDVIKIIQLLPGVNSATEGGQGFYVRGGGSRPELGFVG